MEDYYKMKKEAIANIVQETWLTWEFDKSSNDWLPYFFFLWYFH